jgi:hypothetical protein
MKKILLISLLILSAPAIAKNVLVIGQSNAVGIATKSGIPATIINCAHNGQLISAFKPNFDTRSLFGNCLKRVGSKSIDLIVFWQGEDDARISALASNWAASATTLLLALRQSVGMDVPIILIALNSLPDHDAKYWTWVRDEQLHFYSRNLQVIDSTGFFTQSIDNIHLNQAGYMAIGAEIMSRMQ